MSLENWEGVSLKGNLITFLTLTMLKHQPKIGGKPRIRREIDTSMQVFSLLKVHVHAFPFNRINTHISEDCHNLI